MDKAYIAKYYDETLPYYRLFWHRDSESKGLHYGFWDEDIKNVRDALLNENKFLADLAGIQPDEKVLDAGCGVGGSALWLAKHRGARVVGISLSQKQIKEAKRLSQEAGVDDRVGFYVADFLKMDFKAESFDVVWAMESVCHAERKIDFLKEAFRVLKRGGRLVVADGFLKRSLNASESKLYKDFLIGLALPNLSKFEEFGQWMQEAGFKSVKSFDKTKAIEKSSRALYQRCLVAYPFFKLAHLIGLVSDIVMKNGPAGIAQYKMVKSGLTGYGVFYGEK